MADGEVTRLLAAIRDRHIEIEALLQALGRQQAAPICATCTAICCREAMCRESLDSDFLRHILGRRQEDYDAQQGWLEPGRGCRLTYGRPLVCYEFFCERFDAAGVSGLHRLARRFKTLYARVQGGRHMLEIDDIQRIPPARLARVLADLEQLAGEAAALPAAPPPAPAATPIRFTARKAGGVN